VVVTDQPNRASIEVGAVPLQTPGKLSHSHIEHHGAEVQGPTRDDIIVEEPEPPHKANPLTFVRHYFKEYFGEFIGTMILIIFGNGVNCQVVLTNFKQGEYLSISFGWGIGVM